MTAAVAAPTERVAATWEPVAAPARRLDHVVACGLLDPIGFYRIGTNNPEVNPCVTP